MPFKSIHQLPDEPILIVEYEGFVAFEDVQASSAAAAPLIRAIASDVCQIMDTTQSTSSFTEMLKVLQHFGGGAPDRPFDVHLIFVGTHGMAKFYADAARLKQFGGQIVPIFANRDDALAAARQWLIGKKSGQHQPDIIEPPI